MGRYQPLPCYRRTGQFPFLWLRIKQIPSIIHLKQICNVFLSLFQCTDSIFTLYNVIDEEPSLLERSGLSDYEAKLSNKKEEVVQLMQERDKLMATHRRLLELQKKMHVRQVRGCGH